eukprot:3303-Pelagococcus_subviridis.AAC.2
MRSQLDNPEIRSRHTRPRGLRARSIHASRRARGRATPPRASDSARESRSRPKPARGGRGNAERTGRSIARVRRVSTTAACRTPPSSSRPRDTTTPSASGRRRAGSAIARCSTRTRSTSRPRGIRTSGSTKVRASTARVSRDRHSFTARPPSSLFAPPGGRLPHDADLSVPVSVTSPVRRPRLTDATRPLDALRSSLSTRSPHEQPAAGDVVRRALRKRQRGRVRTRGAVDVQRQRRRDGEDLGPARGGVPARVREQRRGDVRGVAPESGASRLRPATLSAQGPSVSIPTRAPRRLSTPPDAFELHPDVASRDPRPFTLDPSPSTLVLRRNSSAATSTATSASGTSPRTRAAASSSRRLAARYEASPSRATGRWSSPRTARGRATCGSSAEARRRRRTSSRYTRCVHICTGPHTTAMAW